MQSDQGASTGQLTPTDVPVVADTVPLDLVNGGGRQRHPDHRHLRRAAEALAGRDDDTDVWVAIEVADELPFDCRVFDSAADAHGFADAHSTETTPWAVLPCHSEKHELSRGKESRFFCLMHDETSPITSHYAAGVDRKDITGMRLILDRKDMPPHEIDLSAHLNKYKGQNLDRPTPVVDAIFMSFEAMDKYVFPNLVLTYGTRGANTLRQRIKKELEDAARAEGFDAMIP